MSKETAYKDLPIGTKLITSTFYHWIKITNKTWRCIKIRSDETGWQIGDIYTDWGNEEIDNEDIYIMPFENYLKQLENDR